MRLGKQTLLFGPFGCHNPIFFFLFERYVGFETMVCLCVEKEGEERQPTTNMVGWMIKYM